MILLTHICIALFSVGFAIFSFFKPSFGKQKVSYSLVVATLVTGTYLVFGATDHIVAACSTAFVYLSIVLALVFGAQKKLGALAQKEIDA